MLGKTNEVLLISRRLTQKRKDDLRSWVKLAYAAECSARKSMELNDFTNIKSPVKPQDLSCENSMQRRKK